MAMSAALDAARRLGLRPGRTRSPGDSGLLRLSGARDGIDMLQRRHGYFPRIFAWRGCWYEVDAVERCWTVTRRGLLGRVERGWFRVRVRPRCGDGREASTFEIYQDLRKGTWHMGRRVT